MKVKPPKWFAGISLRTRLSTAFVVLIVTSASATIAIGNLVFGQKVVELAASKMEVGLKLAELSLSTRLKSMDRLARLGAMPYGDETHVDRLCREISVDPDLVDVALVIDSANAVLVLPRRESSAETQKSCIVSQIDRKLLFETDMKSFAELLERKKTSMSGLAALRGEFMKLTRYRATPEEGMFMLAGSPISGGGQIVVATLLNNRADLMSAPLGLVWPEQRKWYDASLFLGNQRVASTIGRHAKGTHPDPKVFEQVLVKGQSYVGMAEAVGHNYYTAYMPLHDFRGKTIGILGMGSREEAYVDIRNRTITLFSGLIVAGMTFGFLMTYLFSGWLIKPIRALAEGMNRVARGDLSYKVFIYSKDELGRLAAAFNLMVKNIKERDIKLRDVTEERLTQVEKQVSIGRLAAGVAHEINNPLTSVLSLSILLKKHLPEGDPRHEDLEIIVTETTRCREIVRHLLDFAREGSPQMKVVDINEVIKDTLVLTNRYEGMDNIRTVLRLSDDPFHVNADSKQLQQVFTNIITNAAAAMNGEGILTIATDEDSSGAFAVIQIMDTGKGIPKADLGRIFEPFFTTKDSGKGTGLGLSVSAGIVHKHQGTIEIDSEEGKGTTVTITLPRAVPKREMELK